MSEGDGWRWLDFDVFAGWQHSFAVSSFIVFQKVTNRGRKSMLTRAPATASNWFCIKCICGGLPEKLPPSFSPAFNDAVRLSN